MVAIENITKFINKIKETFNKEREISRICNLRDFDNDEIEFFQIGYRPLIEEDIMERESMLIASDITFAISRGERDFLVNQLIKIKEKQITHINNIEEAKERLPLDTEPLVALIDISKIQEIYSVIKWNEDIYPYGRGDYMFLGGNVIKIYWIKNKINPNYIIIYSKDSFDIIQKKMGVMKHLSLDPPLAFDYKDFSSSNEYLRTVIGYPIEHTKIDVIVNTVLGIKIINPEKIKIFALIKGD